MKYGVVKTIDFVLFCMIIFGSVIPANAAIEMGPVIGVPGGGDVMSGGGVTAGNIDGAGGADMVLTSVDNWAGLDYWRYRVGTNCNASGTCTWSDPQGLDAGADAMSSTAVAAADFDGDGRLDLLLSGVDNWEGLDYWRYRIGTNCNANGACTWSPIQGLDAGAAAMSGGGVAVGQFDADLRPDVVIASIDNWDQGNDYWRYRIGMNCDAQGNCAWTQVQGLVMDGAVMSGGGVSVGDLDNNGVHEIVISGIDNWDQGNDYWRYRIGTNCDTTTGACTWSPIQGLDAGAAVMSGGGVTLANITGNARPEIIVAGIDNWGGLDYWRYRIGTNCNAATGVCTWGRVSTADSGGAALVGGGLTVFDLDANGAPELVLESIDTWDGLDYWRYRVSFTSPCPQGWNWIGGPSNCPTCERCDGDICERRQPLCIV